MFERVEDRARAVGRLAWGVLVAVALLAAGLAFAPARSWADDETSTATVGLTIYDTTDGTTVYNDAVTVSSTATVADVLAEAGFTEADSLDATDGSTTSYYSSYGYPNFLGKDGSSEGWANYWVCLYDGVSDYDGYTALSATVVDGGHYQYVYGSAYTFDYDDYDDLNDPLIVTVALTVVDTTDGTVVYNDAVEVSIGATVADAFAEAGFIEVDEESESSSTSYYSSWDCPEFLGKGYDNSTGCYWVAMYEGSASNYESAYLSATVQDGGHYQYIYANYETTTFEYDDEDTVEAQLTIVDTTDNSVLYNGVVTVEEGATVADLLEAAGFTEADSIEDTAGGTSYYESWSCPEFLGKEYDSSTYAYWVAMYEGSADNYASAYLTATVVEGGHYQYVYGTSYTFEYDDEIADLNPASVYDPLSGYTVDDATDTDTDDTDADDSDVDVDDTDTDADDTTETDTTVELDEEALATLLANLTARFSDGGSDEAISNSTVYAAIALNALGVGSQIDTDAILASLNSYEDTYGYSISAGTLAKYIMALTAGGYDCTELVAQMEALEDGTENVYSIVWILAVYDYGGYSVGESSAWTLDELIDALIESIGDEGLVGAWGYSDTQTTAQAILALLAYADDAEVDAAIETMAEGILVYENADGGFGYASYSTSSNLDATANIVAALAALGYDTTDAVAWLVSQADSTLDGYTEYSDYDEAMTSATVFMALAAYRIAPTSVYELYTTAASTESTTEDSSETLAATGDAALGLVSLTATFGLLMLGAGLGLSRRRAAAPARRNPASRRSGR